MQPIAVQMNRCQPAINIRLPHQSTDNLTAIAIHNRIPYQQDIRQAGIHILSGIKFPYPAIGMEPQFLIRWLRHSSCSHQNSQCNQSFSVSFYHSPNRSQNRALSRLLFPRLHILLENSTAPVDSLYIIRTRKEYSFPTSKSGTINWKSHTESSAPPPVDDWQNQTWLAGMFNGPFLEFNLRQLTAIQVRK